METHPYIPFLSLLRVLGSTAVFLAGTLLPILAQPAGEPARPALAGPWTDKSLPPDRRAELLLEQMTLDEKLGLVHGGSPYTGQATHQPEQSLGGAGWVPGILPLNYSRLPLNQLFS